MAAARVWQAAPWLLHSTASSHLRAPSSFFPRAVRHALLPSSSPTTRCRADAEHRASLVFSALARAEAEESPEESGPVELPTDQDPFAIPSGVSPLQSAGSILFTGVLAVYLYRALRRRAKLVKEKKFRSVSIEKVKEPLLDVKPSGMDLKATPPSAFQAFQGAVIAGAISYVLYKFAILVEASFASKSVSTVYTIRQLTITIRTILSGICYLATFVFAANSVGLMLYAIQLLLNIGPNDATQTKGEELPIEADAMEENLEDAKKE